jgi:sulfatase maturation enzyme AslB (radical SAM superfamily)
MTKTLEITTRIGCQNNCVYCGQKVLLSTYNGNRLMTPKQFNTILSNTPKDIQIDFAGFCEPFLNPWAAWMMRYTIEQGYKTFLLTTLSGFTQENAEYMQGLHFDTILIHEYEGKGFDKEEVDRKVELLMSNVKADTFNQFKLGNEFRFSRAGNVWDREAKKGPFECGWAGREFYRNVVLPNCDVYLCCMDYGLKHKLGSLLTIHYNDLNRKQIVDLTKKEDSDCICRKCEIMRGC